MLETDYKVHKKKRYLIIPKDERSRRFIIQNTGVIIGSIIAAAGFVLFQLPFKLAAGGVTGLAIIINNYVSIPEGMLILGMNIPLLFIGYYYLGGLKFIFSTIVSVLCFSFSVDLFQLYFSSKLNPFPVSNDLLLNCIYAGIVFGFGMGIIYRSGGSIGGTSIPARILQMKTGFPLSQSYLITDMGIILLAGFVFYWELAMLATLTLILGGMVSDFMLEGVSQVRTAMIVTQHPVILQNTLIKELKRDVTTWGAKDLNENDRSVVYCTVRRSQVNDLKYYVSAVDPDALFVIGTAQQVWSGVHSSS